MLQLRAPRENKFEIEEEVSDLGRQIFGQLACPYLKPYLHNARCLDKQYGIQREDDGRFMIGDFILTVDVTSDICINGRHFKTTHGLWEHDDFLHAASLALTAVQPLIPALYCCFASS
jgi:hypothetical protein